jgi:hypothetical protein
LNKKEILSDVLRHVDVKAFDARPLIQAYGDMAFQARNLSRATGILNQMLADRECSVILTLAGSLCSAGLKDALALMVENNMIDAIVSTGANIVDQDFFEGAGLPPLQGQRRTRRRPRSCVRRWASTASTTRTSTRTSCANATWRSPARRMRCRRGAAFSSREFIQRHGRAGSRPSAAFGCEQGLDRARRALEEATCPSSARPSATARPVSAWCSTSEAEGSHLTIDSAWPTSAS